MSAGSERSNARVRVLSRSQPNRLTGKSADMHGRARLYDSKGISNCGMRYCMGYDLGNDNGAGARRAYRQADGTGYKRETLRRRFYLRSTYRYT